MCGIIGGAGRLFKAQEDMVMQLLMLDTQRGPHSTGLLSVAKVTGLPQIIKSLGTPWDLFDVPAFDTFWKRQHKVLLGHNRWATKGKITVRNAHPFSHGNIIGVHNGTLKDQSLLTNHKNFEVDSDNIIHDINQHGAVATIKKLDGAYCLVWFNELLQTINFVRNNERPLFLAKSKDGCSIYWASESWMLNVAASKARVDIEPPVVLPINSLVTYKVNDGGVVLDEDSGIAVEGYSKPWVNYHYKPAKRVYKEEVPGELVEFEISGEVNSKLKYTGYMNTAGEVISGPHKGKTIRIFASSVPDLRSRLLESNNPWQGEITYEFKERVDLTDKWLDIIIIKTASIVELTDAYRKEKDEQAKKLLPAPTTPPVDVTGLIMTRDQFNKKVNLGCYWCGTKPSYEQWDTIHWNKTNTEFLCKDCNQPEYHEYFDDVEESSSTIYVGGNK